MSDIDPKSPASPAQQLIAETLRVPLDTTVREAFTPRQRALLAELERMETVGMETVGVETERGEGERSEAKRKAGE